MPGQNPVTATTVQLAQMSKWAYGGREAGGWIGDPQPWTPPIANATSPNFAIPETGFSATVWRDPSTNQITIAFRGTDDAKGNLAADAKLATGQWHPQFDDAVDLVAKIAAAAGVAPSQITLTGHSLSSALAQVAAK